jgi:hypothetical protein
MATLFEASATDATLATQIVDTINVTASEAGVTFANDPTQLIQVLAQNAAFRQALQSSLSQLAVANGLQFTVEAGVAADRAVSALSAIQDQEPAPQIPISQPIALLFIAAVLIFAPNVFQSVGATLYGSSTVVSAVDGVAPF